MARGNLDIAQGLVDTFNRRDLDGLRDWLHDDCEFRSKIASIEGVVYHGKQGGVDYVRDIDAYFDDWHLEDISYHEAGDDQVLLLYRVKGFGKGSGVPVETELAMVWKMRDGHAWRGEVLDRAEALASAGLSEPPQP